MPGRPQAEEGQQRARRVRFRLPTGRRSFRSSPPAWTEAQRSALDAEVKKRDLDRRIEELEKKLAALAPARIEQTEVKVFVVAAAPLDADLTVRYQVRNAGWTPRYDARLATGSKTTPPLLELTRRADIVQRTGESWDNVAAAAVDHTSDRQAAAPVIDTVTVDFEPEAQPACGQCAPPAPAAHARRAASQRRA